MVSKAYDMVVVGAGCAGLAAALQAAQCGLSVAVVEKAAAIGGAADGGHGLFAVGSHLQRDRQVPLSVDQAFRFFMDFTHWRVDAQLMSAYVRKSADTVAWLERIGIRFLDVVSYFPGAHQTWHFKDPESPKITDALWQNAKALGAELLVDTAADGVVLEQGRVCGLRVRDAQGGTRLLPAATVVIATGGFSGNAEWVQRHLGYRVGVDAFPFDLPAMVGDGIRIAWEAGAAPSEMTIDAYVCMPPPYHGPGGTTFELGSFRQPNLMVNAQGVRFMNEEVMANPGFAANAVHRQPDGCGFMLFDAATHAAYVERGWDVVMSKLPVTRPDAFEQRVAEARAGGYRHLFVADSLAELAAQMDIPEPPLQATVDRYNAACDSGRDAEFFKSAERLRPLRHGPFYAARFYIGGYGGLGGIRINHRTEVLGRSGDTIEGLYAAGNDANALFGDTYPFAMSGNASSFCFNTGRIAAEQAAALVRGRQGASSQPIAATVANAS